MSARVCLYVRDSELRTWLVDELALLSPSMEVLAVDRVQALDAASELAIIELDALSLADVDFVAELIGRRATAVIAIGTPTGVLGAAAFAHVLAAELTSKQLKRAVRETLARIPARSEARHGA